MLRVKRSVGTELVLKTFSEHKIRAALLDIHSELPVVSTGKAVAGEVVRDELSSRLSQSSQDPPLDKRKTLLTDPLRFYFRKQYHL